MCDGKGKVKRAKKRVVYEEAKKDFRKIYKGDKINALCKQLISQSVGKTLSCTARDDEHHECEFYKEILKYFEPEIEKVGEKNIKEIVSSLRLLFC